MRARFWKLCIIGLIPMWVACGEAEKRWIPVCYRLPTAEAERIVTDGGERLIEGRIRGNVALKGEEMQHGRSIWAVVLEVRGTTLVLLHDTDPRVESPSHEGWQDGEWRSYDAQTQQLLLYPLNSVDPDPFPDSVAETALNRCDLSLQPF